MITAITKILISIFAFASFYVVLEHVYKKFNLRALNTRKIAHVVSGFGAIGLLYFLSVSQYVLVLAFFALFFSGALWYRVFNSIHLQERKTYGEVLYPIGILFALLISNGDPRIMVPSILVLTIADPAAELVGRRYSKSRKTIMGSLAFFLCTLCILLTTLIVTQQFSGINLLSILVITFLATLGEWVSSYGTDNVTIPLIICLGLLIFF